MTLAPRVVRPELRHRSCCAGSRPPPVKKVRSGCRSGRGNTQRRASSTRSRGCPSLRGSSRSRKRTARGPGARLRVVPRFDAILFDAGETLVHPDPSFPELIARFIGERGHTVSTNDVIEAEATLAGRLYEKFVTGGGWSFTTESSRAHWTSLYREFAEQLGIDDQGLADHLYDRFRMPE